MSRTYLQRCASTSWYYQAAQKIAHSLLCASNQICRAESPYLVNCAVIVRSGIVEAGEGAGQRGQEAQQKVLARQVDYISTFGREVRWVCFASQPGELLRDVPVEKVSYMRRNSIFLKEVLGTKLHC